MSATASAVSRKLRQAGHRKATYGPGGAVSMPGYYVMQHWSGEGVVLVMHKGVTMRPDTTTNLRASEYADTLIKAGYDVNPGGTTPGSFFVTKRASA